MRIVDLNEDSRRITVLSYGAMRAGKTRFAASFPRPLFLSDNTETGWTTIKHADPTIFFEAGVKPVIWAIERASDMMEAIIKLEDILRNEPGRFLTVVVDSLTFYADLYFNMLEQGLRAGGKAPDNRMLFMHLAAHLRDLRIRVHNMNINVVWLCLEKTPSTEEPIGGPMLSGQSAQKFAAGCGYILYHRSYQAVLNGPPLWEIRTRKYGLYPAGGRDEGRVPDPLGYISEEIGDDGQVKQIWTPDCTYRTLALSLGISDEDALTPPPPPTTSVVTKPLAATTAVQPIIAGPVRTSARKASPPA